MRGAELQAVLVFDRHAGEYVDDRAATKDDIGGVDLGRVVGRADDCELTVRGKVLPEQRRHRCAAGRPPDPKTATNVVTLTRQ
jgi:hypothetical protein